MESDEATDHNSRRNETQRAESTFARIRRISAENKEAKRLSTEQEAQEQIERKLSAGSLVTAGVFGTSSIEIYEGGFVRVAAGEPDDVDPATIKKSTPFELLKSIKFQPPGGSTSAENANPLNGAVGTAVNTLLKGGKGLLKSSLPGLAVSGISHLAGAESRRAYLTIATDKAIYALTNESHNGFLKTAKKGHNEVGSVLAAAGREVLGQDDDSRPLETPQPVAESELADRLRELSSLHRDGILTAEEFAAAKALLLGGL